MKVLPVLALMLSCLVPHSRLCAAEKADIVVAQDGSGMYATIQAAIDAVPDDNAVNIIILVKNGTYHEKLSITKDHLTLVGEDRDSTRIIYAELRKNVKKNAIGGRSDWGAAVVNIDSAVTDLTLANLTVYNNYGSLYNDTDHQFAIRGGGTRVIIINCTIKADGGDTLSLWNKVNGMYYHAFCSFEGWVDYVCPRGWCYITDSKFFGHNLSASIWHDGDAEKSQKFVIRSSVFDGVQGFPLGRNHRDGQIYLLDCMFSRAMADTPIYLPPGSKPWQWGDRHFYYNCHRDGGDYGWFRDNLASAAGAPTEEDITPAWTFDGKWDPERAMPAVLPIVYLPNPRDGSTVTLRRGITVAWVPSRNADRELVYFGKGSAVRFVKSIRGRSFRTGLLAPHTQYSWRIDEVAGKDTLHGPLWHFTTR